MKFGSNLFESRSTANPQMAHIVMRTLAVCGPMEESRLRNLIRPDAVVAGTEDQWHSTLAVLQDLGILQNAPELDLMISFEVQADRRIDLPQFQMAFRRVLIQHSHMSIEEGQKPSDLAIGLLWLSMVDDEAVFKSFSGGSTSPELSLRDLVLTDAFGNNEQWNSFRRWANALGILRLLPREQVCPDFTRAMAELLARHPGEYSASAFVELLNAEFLTLQDPVLLGWYRSRNPQFEPTMLSSQVSRSLLNLEARGLLTLKNENDAGDHLTISGAERPFNYVMTGATSNV